MNIESSSSIYIELEKRLSSKAIKSLTNLKAACDLIVTTQGEMNYSSAARVATKSFGGPKIQTVQNNKNLKHYVGARILEYHQTRKIHNLPDTKKNNASVKLYPTDNLDSRTKIYIDQLHTRLELAESRYSNMRDQQEKFTLVNPLNLAEAIECGPTTSGSMQFEYRHDDSQFLYSIREGIRSLLGLVDHISSLDIETREDKKRITLKRPAGNIVVLSPQQYIDIQHFLEESCND